MPASTRHSLHPSTEARKPAGFIELVGERGHDRWSLRRFSAWIDAHLDDAVSATIGDLTVACYYQHQRIGLGKVSPTDNRDPFCVASDNGYLTWIRDDQPFWTRARHATVNHLLWTLGAVDEPDGTGHLTKLGQRLAGANA